MTDKLNDMKNNYFNRTSSLLSLAISLFGLTAIAQSDYTVTAIPHQVYSAFTPVEFTQDDIYSGIIPLTFNFTYFGNNFSATCCTNHMGFR